MCLVKQQYFFPLVTSGIQTFRGDEQTVFSITFIGHLLFTTDFYETFHFFFIGRRKGTNAKGENEEWGRVSYDLCGRVSETRKGEKELRIVN